MLMAALSLAPAPAVAETTQLRLTQASYGSTQTLAIDLNKSVIIDLPADVRDVIVGQPSVATTIMRTKRRAIVQGTSAGSTNIFFLDSAGRTISVIDVTVIDSSTNQADANALSAALARIIPGSHIIVENFGERVVLSGTVNSGDDLDKAVLIATQFTGDAEHVANLIAIGGGQQVKLKVTVAEVNRDVTKQFGINLNGNISVGPVRLGLNNQPAQGQVSSLNYTAGAVSIDATLQALEKRGAAHTLAEPTLTALSGQPAEFLVGGQLPYQTVDQNGNTITSFKDYGVQLNFTPTVKSNGQILLAVDTSVSEPKADNSISKRSAKTTVELIAGQTLSIAGIFQDSVTQDINQLPGLGDVPILGALFRSRNFLRHQTELVILVTPYIAQPGQDTALPTDNTAIASDAEGIFLGRLETIYGVGQHPHPMKGGYHGSVGFVLD
jgi:pilus assembly protein CpaC